MAGIALVALLWAALTKPAKTSPSSSWEAALSLAEEGVHNGLLEWHNPERKAAGALPSREEGETPGIPQERTLLYPGVRAVGKATGSCYVTISEDGPAGLSISSTGIVHDEYRTLAQRTLQVTARRRPLFESAVFARKGLFIGAGAGIEDGTQARRAGLHPLRVKPFRIGSIREQTENPLSPGWRPEEEDSEEERLPLLLPPWGLPRRSAVTLSGGDVLTLTKSGAFPTVTLLDSSTLILVSDAVVHIAGPLTLMGRSRIVIGPRVRNVSIYIDKDVMVEENAAILNLTQSPLSLSMISMEQGSRITLRTRAPLYATIYAPNADVQLGPEAYLRGSVCGDTLHLLAGTKVAYDERLASLQSPQRPFAVVSCVER
jgi:hypothetical protein